MIGKYGDEGKTEMNYDKIDVAALLYKAADALRWQEEILKLPSCHDCGKVGRCEYEPTLGQYVRINCPHWT